MGFTQKSIEFNIILSPTGELVTLQRLSEKAQAFAVPSTPEAESRSSDIRPFPLASSLEYLMPKKQNGKLDSYLAKLKAWCAEPHAPQCLRVLLAWLQKKTLYAGLPNVVGLKLEYDKGDTPGKGKDVDKTVCLDAGKNRVLQRGMPWRGKPPVDARGCKEQLTHALCSIAGR